MQRSAGSGHWAVTGGVPYLAGRNTARGAPASYAATPGGPYDKWWPEGNSNPGFPLCMRVFLGWLLFCRSAETP